MGKLKERMGTILGHSGLCDKPKHPLNVCSCGFDRKIDQLETLVASEIKRAYKEGQDSITCMRVENVGEKEPSIPFDKAI